MAIKMNRSKLVWFKLFGYPIGTKVRLKKEYWNRHLYMYCAVRGMKPTFKIPIDKFVGVIIRKFPTDGKRTIYEIKWWADRRSYHSPNRGYLWSERYIEALP